MTWQNIQDGLLVTLVLSYEEDPHQFVTLSRQALDSSSTRAAVAELRNEGFVEEQVRGVIRLTARGYRQYKTTASGRLCGPSRCMFLKGWSIVRVCFSRALECVQAPL